MRISKNVFLILLPIAACLAFSASSHAQSYETEKILSFDSDIVVNADSTMTVIETIKVVANGTQIKRGIYRDFPTRYKDKYGNDLVVDFTLTKVSRNGYADNYHITNLTNGKRLYIGDKDVFLTPGEYTYVISYKTDRQLGFFDKFDELYWNVTGNGWAFPIEKVTATVTLPKDAGARLIEATGYTGYKGSTEQAVYVSKDMYERTVFTATRPLGESEGVTIVVTWPKGYVTEPSLETKIIYVVRDNAGAVLALLGLVVLIIYYLFVWLRVGKDPAKGTIIPLYEPPDKLSPADMRYVIKMGFDDKILTAIVVNLAVKGCLKINEENRQYILEEISEDSDTLTKEERRMLEILFASGKKLELKNTNHGIIQKAIKYLKDSLKLRYEKIYFLTNKEYFITGAVLSLVLMLMSIIFQNVLSGQAEKIAVAFFMCVWLSGWTFGVITLLFTVISLWRQALKNPFNLPAALFMSLFSVPFVIGEIFGIGMLLYATSFLVMVALVAVIVVNIVFYRLLKAPTFMGRKIMDKIEGFKMYLSVAEKIRLNVLNPPEKTPELFEKYLPYALALGVEQQWAEKFSDVLAKAGVSGESYHPSWYSGSTLGAFSATSFAQGLSGFSGAVSSSSVAPGSSSGSGGGGSSGGGGGGGGGGGW